MSIFLTGLLLCMKWLFSLRIMWHLMWFCFFCFVLFTQYYKNICRANLCRVLPTNKTLRHPAGTWMNVSRGKISTAKLFLPSNVICSVRLLERLLLLCLLFEWFGNVSLKWTEVSAQHTVDCRVPDLQHCHVEALSFVNQPTPSKKRSQNVLNRKRHLDFF